MTQKHKESVLKLAREFDALITQNPTDILVINAGWCYFFGFLSALEEEETDE